MCDAYFCRKTFLGMTFLLSVCWRINVTATIFSSTNLFRDIFHRSH